MFINDMFPDCINYYSTMTTIVYNIVASVMLDYAIYANEYQNYDNDLIKDLGVCTGIVISIYEFDSR